MSNNDKHHRSSNLGFYSLKAFLKITAVVAVVAFTALAGINVQANPIQFVVNCPTCNSDASTALSYAGSIWGNLLSSNYLGETIAIDASFGSLPPGALASTHPSDAVFDDSYPMAMASYFMFPVATANHLALNDLNGAQSEITMKFSSAPPDPWWFDTSEGSTQSGYYDFVSVALHEIAHGLGLVSGLQDNMLYPFTVPYGICSGCGTGWYYDTYVKNIEANTWPISESQADRLALVTNPSKLVFTGYYATEANGGVPPVLYSPPTFKEGSSIGHLSENPNYGYPDDLMVPHATLGGYNHTPSAIDLGMLKDVGWISVAVPEPSSLLLLITGAGILFGVYRRKRR